MRKLHLPSLSPQNKKYCYQAGAVVLAIALAGFIATGFYKLYFILTH